MVLSYKYTTLLVNLPVRKAGTMRRILLVLVALSSAVVGDETPTCPQRTPMSDYNCPAFHGTWYILMRSSTDHFDQNDHCPQIVVEDRPNGTISFTTKFVRPGESEFSVFEGNYWRTEEEGTQGIAWVNYPEKFGDWKTRYYILGTDYNNYAVTWACWITKNGVLHDHSWVMGRTPEITDDIRRHASEVAQLNNLDLETFVTTTQTDCPS